MAGCIAPRAACSQSLARPFPSLASASGGHFRCGKRTRASMALDLYQRLGLKRGATEAEIKKAYRSLAKQLHPDRNKDNPDAARRFGEITQAYDLLSDKDKRAQYDRGEIDEEGNPKMPFGGGYGRRPGGAAGAPPPGFEGFETNFADTADLSD